MRQELIVAPSLLAADFLDLRNDLDRAVEAGVKWLHFDVMDGHFVKNISFGSDILKQIIAAYPFFMDVHIMVNDPEHVALPFIEAGANLITFHLEATDDPMNTIEVIKAHNPDTLVGMSIKPLTEVEDILPFLPYLDLVLVMSVEPGKGGQRFNIEAIDKIEALRNYIDENDIVCRIEVDGGINGETGIDAIGAGADTLVAGTYLFRAEDFQEAYDALFVEDSFL